MKYLCYDIKGIQRLIFSVPRLKAIVGGSGLIDQFDRFASNQAGNIYAGGGKGAFHYPEGKQQADLEPILRTEAHKHGLDIQFGEDASIKTAAESADRLFPYIPDELTAFPCQVSGLLPAAAMNRTNDKILHRMRLAKIDQFGKDLLVDLGPRLPESFSEYAPVFFRNVKGESVDDDTEDEKAMDQHHANAAASSIGRRNRWAVIAMDGNDIGSQYSAYSQLNLDEEDFIKWLKEMSSKLKLCTREGFLAAVAKVLNEWVADGADLEKCSYDEAGVRKLVLPLRPLILGGDDVILLCHTKYAFQFVQTMSDEFTRQSEQAAKESPVKPLWPASGGKLTISAGVLFTNVHLPLHSAIPYAEKLLKNAKRKFRRDPETDENKQEKMPTTAAIDFEIVTDSLIDNPADRRRRELIFKDEELVGTEIHLTRRPYALSATKDNAQPTFAKLRTLADTVKKLPKSIRAQLFNAMCQPWSARTTFLVSLAKRHPEFYHMLAEDHSNLGSAWISSNEGKRQETSVIDALLLLEEDKRSLRETV